MRKAFKVSLILLLAATLLASCSNERKPRSSTAHSAEKPVYGGTLRVVQDSGYDHLLTTSAYVTDSLLLLRTFARQLVAYRSSTWRGGSCFRPVPMSRSAKARCSGRAS